MIPTMERVGQAGDRQTRPREDHLVDLLERTASGDQQALASLYDATSRFVHGLALRILRDPGAAEDITMDVYLQVFRQAARYDPGRGTSLAWLLVLTRSRAIDRLRADTQRRTRETSTETASLPPSPEAGPDEWTAGAEVQRSVGRALEALSPEQRRAIELAYYHGLSQSQIAERLALPLGTVKTRIRTAMMRLREQLHGVRGGEAV
jgi:RNA polymerase sigma-70 factor (ECF subfamily)